MSVVVTGAAGFIGFHVSQALLERGDSVIGIDSLSDYYSVALKEARLERLKQARGFAFHRVDIAERGALETIFKQHPQIDRIVHLAAQAGVRHSIENPRAYGAANLIGHLEVLEASRNLKGLKHLVFASSSSVYGGNTKLPFAVEDRVDTPQSLYAATKKADELMSCSYAHLYGIPSTGLRFFTVYGPWGRPDMAAWLFTAAILGGTPIKLFNRGLMRRDFTYIDDIVNGVLLCLDKPPHGALPYKIYNLGNHRSEELMRLVALLESAIGRKAKLELLPMQPGDVEATYADISETARDLGFSPTTSIDVGVPRFVDWYLAFHKGR